MIKRMEIEDENSCLNRAAADEIIFVLRAKDPAAPETIRRWMLERIALGLNRRDDEQIASADACADYMEVQGKRIRNTGQCR